MRTIQAIKRIHRDLIYWRESERNFRGIFAEPVEDDMFTWHFNMFAGKDEATPIAIHGEIKFPTNYPLSPPTVAFFDSVPHRQVSRISPGKMAVLCLDMLQDNNRGYYSGWSSAYSIVSVLAQIETLLEDVPAESIPRGWSRFTCLRCSHDGSRVSKFHPQIKLCSTTVIQSSAPTESSTDWSRLNRDVDGIIFSFLGQNDYRVLVHVDTHIKNILLSNRWYHWKSIDCYHSHQTFGDFTSVVQDSNVHLHRESVFQHLFGIGFSVDYFENEQRGKRGYPGTTELVLKDVYVTPDVLSYRAFKEGVTFSMWRDSRFTSFLPLYLNNLHGAYAMFLAEKVIREQYQETTNQASDPTLVLKFLSKLMNTTVVSLMCELDEGNEDGVQLFTSIKALQSYMYFHHLLLGFCEKYPRITSYARKKVYDFVNKPDCRNKTHCPDLGEFLVYLSIVPNMKWETFGPVFTEEAFVRNAKWILEKHPELITTHRNSEVSCIRLRRTWEASKVGKRLQMFQYYFLRNICGVATSDGPVLDLDARLEEYNRTLGQVDESVGIELQQRCRLVFQVDDWMQYFSMVNLPCPSARALTHLLRESMVESDRKGYQRFFKFQMLKKDALVHENPDLCICSGAMHSRTQRSATLREEEKLDLSQDSTERFLDVAFSVDCTGSMMPYLNSVEQHIQEIAKRLTNDVEQLNVRFAIVGYRDHGHEAGDWAPQVTSWFGFSNVKTFKKNLLKIHVGDGSDVESVADAWHQVMALNWRQRSVKAVIHIADIGGHGLCNESDVCPNGFDPVVLARAMLASDITLYNVGCQMRSEIHEKFYKATAFMTGGLYLTLENALKLPQVIVESMREGISLSAVIPTVHDLLKQFKKEQPLATRDQLAYFVWKELVEQQVLTRKVKCVAADELSTQVHAASKSRDLTEYRQILNDASYDRTAKRLELAKQRRQQQRPRSKKFRSYDEYQREYQKEQKKKRRQAKRSRKRRKMAMNKAEENRAKFEVVRSRVENDDRLITFEQTLRCMTRAEEMANRIQWLEKGCVYQMTKYNVTAARARYVKHGMEYSGKLIRIKKSKFNVFDVIEYDDYETGRIYAATVLEVDPSRYTIAVSIGGLRNARREVPLTSRSLRNMITAVNFASIVDEAKKGEDQTRTQLGNHATPFGVMEDMKQEHLPVSAVVPPTPPLPVSIGSRPFTALCVVLPNSLWGGIQRIRRQHDKHYQRWRMPMIMLPCPFVDWTVFEEHAEHLHQAFRLCGLKPFRVEVTGIGLVTCARVGKEKMVEGFLRTSIASEDDRSWDYLIHALSVVYPNHVGHEVGELFKPRIMLGQIPKKHAKQVIRGWKAAFSQGMTFRVSKVSLLSRSGFNLFHVPFAAKHEAMW